MRIEEKVRHVIFSFKLISYFSVQEEEKKT